MRSTSDTTMISQATPPDWLAAATTQAGLLLAQFSHREFAILLDRELILTAKPTVTLEELGARFGLTRERIRQLEGKARERLRWLFSSSTFTDLREAAEEISRELGAAVALEHLPAPWRRVVMARTPEHRLLMYLAGPYEVHDELLVRRNAIAGVSAAIQQIMGSSSIAPLQQAIHAVVELGLREDQVLAVLERLNGYRIIGPHLLRWTGSLADKAEAILAGKREPLTAEELSDAIGGSYSIGTLKNYLGSDGRFQRVGKLTWALSVWGGEEYPGAAAAIVAELERRGGGAALDHLSWTLSDRFGISPSSVMWYAGTSPLFVQDGGWVRLRMPDEPYAWRQSLEQTATCFVVDGAWAWRAPVDHDLLRGSGRAIPEAFALHIGLAPGRQLWLHATVGDIPIAWGVQYPTIGSLRQTASRLSAASGDFLVIRYLAPSTLDFRRIKAGEMEHASAKSRAALLTGNRPDAFADPVPAMATALGFVDPSAPYGEIVRRIVERGDHGLLAAFIRSTSSLRAAKR